MITLNNDPTNGIQKDLIKILKNNSALSDHEKFLVKCMNPRAPRLYGLIKNHKPNKPIRPVVSFTNSPTWKLAKKLNLIVRNVTKFKSFNSVKNSLELSKFLNSIRTRQNINLVSFDVCSMFSNIPPQECLFLVKNLLFKSNVNSNLSSDILILLNYCVSINYFQFDNKFYKQNSGLAMGCPLSPLLAEIFMNNFETIILSHSLSCKHIIFWKRYVDDILAGFCGTERQLNIFLDFLNSLHANIKFTLEIENEFKSINYLDLKIFRYVKLDGYLGFDFKIFRKSTYTDSIIPAESFHPFCHKMSTFRALLNRAFDLPLSKNNFDLEINFIKRIAINNGYSINTINNFINKFKIERIHKIIYPQSFSKTNSKFYTLSYFGSISDKIAVILRKQNLNISFKSLAKLQYIIFNHKDNIELLNKSGVYLLTCSCNAIYIGQTGRNFKIRLNEHLKAIKNKSENSTFGNHILLNNHIVNNSDCIKILHIEDKGQKLNYLEAIEIFKHKSKNYILLNEQIDLLYSILFKCLN